MFSGRLRSFLELAVIVGVVMGGMTLMRSHQAVEQGQVLRASARPGDIRMISSATCSYCNSARAWLTEQRVPFQECIIETESTCLAEFQERGARGTPTFVVRGQTVLGFDPHRIAELIRR